MHAGSHIKWGDGEDVERENILLYRNSYLYTRHEIEMISRKFSRSTYLD